MKILKGGEPFFIDKGSDVGILMLHGFTSTPRQFKELGFYFSKKGFTVYAPLIAGHGTSPQDLEKTSSDDWVKSAKDAYLKLKEKVKEVIVIGNSFGGNLALKITNDLDGEILGVVSLGTPIFLKHQWIIKLRLHTYGRFVRFYRKPFRVYKMDYTDMVDEITYSLIPIRSFRFFLNFIKKETIPGLKKIKTPVLVAHADTDPVVNPKSAAFIYEKLGSPFKKMYWFSSRFHVITCDKKTSEDLFKKIFDFINEAIENRHKQQSININNKNSI